jgi:nucleotide-binding universal stress UspA family protein
MSGNASSDGEGADLAGTMLCGVTDSPEGRTAAQVAGALSDRLGVRLVLVHVVDGSPGGSRERTAQQGRVAAERTLETIASAAAVPRGTELRVEFGRRAELLARIAAEEGADLIVLGSRARGWHGRRLRCRLARELEVATPSPVLIAPPQTRKRSDRRLTVAESSTVR